MHYQLADLYEALTDANPNAEVLIAGNVSFTRKRLDERANQLAHYLSSVGVRRGDYVGVYAYNRAEWMEALLASWKIGACIVNINYRYVPSELHYMWTNAGMKALIYERRFATHVELLRGDFASLQNYVWLEDASSCPEPVGVSYEDALAKHSLERGFSERSDDDLYLVYTGGTTGMPKGVLWRHFDLYHNVVHSNRGTSSPESILAVAALAKPMRSLTLSPLMHGGGQFACIWTIFNGGVSAIPVSTQLEPANIVTTLIEQRISILSVIGDAMARPIAEAQLAARRDVTTLSVVSSGGAVLSDATRALLKRAFGESLLITGGVGASELGAAGKESGKRAEGGGPRFTPTATVAVLDDNLNVISPGSKGQGFLAMRGYIPLGYHNDPEKTARVFRTDAAGTRWVIAGDRVQMEEDGTFALLGRDSLCINSGGEKIYVEEVERAVLSHPAVRRCAVVGVADPVWQERVAVIAELESGAELTLAELQTHCRQHIAGYKIPRYCFFATLPVTPNGKTDYPWAKEYARAACAAQVSGQRAHEA